MDYDEITQDFDTYGEDAHTDWLGFRRVEELFRPLKDKAILDYGCGPGRFARFLRDKGAKITGVDISSQAIERAQKTNTQDITFTHIKKSGDLSFASDNTFDGVVAAFVLDGVKTDADIKTLCTEIYRVLKPGASFIILGNNWEQCAGRAYRSFVLHACPETVGEEVEVLLKLPEGGVLKIKEYYRPNRFYEAHLSRIGFFDVRTEQVHPESDDPEWMAEADCPPLRVISGAKSATTTN